MPRIHDDHDLLEDDYDEVRPSRRGRNLSVAAKERIAEHSAGRVVQVDRGHVSVLYEGVEYLARFAGSMRGVKVVVGDRVRVKPPRHETDLARVIQRLPRETVLARTGDDDLEDERIVVANADQVVVVIGADYLDGGVGFLERVLVAASAGGLRGAVCVNKCDLAAAGSPDTAAVEGLLARYAAIGVAGVAVSAHTGEGLEALRELLAGRWSAFAGHSGVGKTSLFNQLVPGVDREVGDIGRRGGRHTTVAARAEHVADIDAWLVDTPGIRSFGLGGLAPEDLADHFTELAGLDREVRQAIEAGGEPPASVTIDPVRLRTFRRFLAALRGDEPWDDFDDGRSDGGSGGLVGDGREGDGSAPGGVEGEQ